MTSYTDEQVREHAAWQVGETRKIMIALLADRTRLQAEVSDGEVKIRALRNRLISERTEFYLRSHTYEHARALAEADTNAFEQAFDSARAKKGGGV